MSAFARTAEAADPFPHVRLDNWFDKSLNDAALSWFETDAPWRLRVASFYEQYEFSLLVNKPPVVVAGLISADAISNVTALFADRFADATSLALVDIAAHRLVAGQTIRVHNDYIGDAETHRMLVQFNHGWGLANGGLLMLFGSDRSEDVREAIVPHHGSAFAFALSPKSFHAVSKIISGDRFTLVYTFRKV